jgi:hypothetical protein
LFGVGEGASIDYRLIGNACLGCFNFCLLAFGFLLSSKFAIDGIEMRLLSLAFRADGGCRIAKIKHPLFIILFNLAATYQSYTFLALFDRTFR